MGSETATAAQFTLAEASHRVREGTVSPVELTEACLRRIDELNPQLNAFITITAASALAEARAAEHEIQRGNWRGPLHGIPIALKDLVDTAGVATTAASNLFRNRIPTSDAEIVRLLKAAGAIFVGKLNLHEFAYGGSSVVTAFGPVHNPRAPEYSAGGSSSGSAAAVGAGLCFGAVGTCTGGSIRQPAALCGIVGFKPTYGLVSAQGVVPLSPSLDHIGPMTRTVADTALFLQAMAPNFDLSAAPKVASLRVGIPRRHFFEALHPEVVAAVDSALSVILRLTAGTHTVHPAISIDEVNSLSNLLTKTEAYAYHRQHVTATPELYQPETLRRIRTGADVSPDTYTRGLRELETLRLAALHEFEAVDVWITPTSPVPAFTIADLLSDPQTLRNKEQLTLRNTRPFNVLGWPTISVPCGSTREGLPIGLQISARPGADATVLALAAAYEQAAGTFF